MDSDYDYDSDSSHDYYNNYSNHDDDEIETEESNHSASGQDTENNDSDDDNESEDDSENDDSGGKSEESEEMNNFDSEHEESGTEDSEYESDDENFEESDDSEDNYYYRNDDYYEDDENDSLGNANGYHNRFLDYFSIASTVMMPSGNHNMISQMSKTCSHFMISCDYCYELFDVHPCETERKIVENEMRRTIMQHRLQENGGGKFRDYKIINVKKLFNPCLWDRFTACKIRILEYLCYTTTDKMLFHGTTESSATSILKYGFDINKASSGGMFGKAIYFAEHSSKSNQYTYGFLGGTGCPLHHNKSCYSCPRTVLLCRVVLGTVTTKTHGEHINPNPNAYTTIHGVPTPNGLRYPEYAIYNGDQAYPEYLITYVIVP